MGVLIDGEYSYISATFIQNGRVKWMRGDFNFFKPLNNSGEKWSLKGPNFLGKTSSNILINSRISKDNSLPSWHIKIIILDKCILLLSK